VRRHFVRAGDASPQQLKYWTDAWLERIRDLYAAHDGVMAAWQDGAAPAAREEEAAAARMEKAQGAWDTVITAIDEARKKQMAAPGLQAPREEGARHPGPPGQGTSQMGRQAGLSHIAGDDGREVQTVL